MDFPPNVTFFLARAQTSAMFARIGVKLEWRMPDRCPAGALQISLSDNTPPDFHPGALGYAKLYDGTHIVVLWDRVQTTVTRERVTALLAHVMTHEITHVLEGVSRHSDSGVMKARWTETDYGAMRTGLPFASVDVGLIHDGLTKRVKPAVTVGGAEYHEER
jgi:hypothetical protein